MTTTMKVTARKSANTDQRDKLIQETSQAHSLLGEVGFWSIPDNRGIVNSYQTVVDALKDSGLNEKVAKEFLPAQAFNRACTKLREEGVIDVIRNDKDEILFQLSKRTVKDDITEGGQEFLYQKEAKILLNKDTGALSCKDPVVLAKAKEELDRCLAARTTSDVSNIVNKLFQDQGDLIPMGTGVFFVPQEHVAFLDKIENFMKKLGRRVIRLPLPKEMESNRKNVAVAMEEYFDGLIQEMDQAVANFNLSTRPSTVEGVAERINSCRDKIQAYITYLPEKAAELQAKVDHSNMVLMAKVTLLEEERKTSPPEQRGSMRQRVLSCLNGTPKSVSELCEEAGTNTNGIKTYLEEQVSKGMAARIGEKYRLADVVQ